MWIFGPTIMLLGMVLLITLLLATETIPRQKRAAGRGRQAVELAVQEGPKERASASVLPFVYDI